MPSDIVLRVNATWPFGLISLSDTGVQISALSTRWTADWEAIRRAGVDPHAVLFELETGRGARFRCIRPDDVRWIVSALENHHVEIERVRSTYWSAWRL